MNQRDANVHGTASLFIGDLSKFCTESEIESLFHPFGQILDVKIKRNNLTGKTLSYGFVTFALESAANNAMRHLDGTMFFGRKLRIRWAMYNAKSNQKSPANSDSVINSVYVRYVTNKLDQFVTEENFHRVFDAFGGVLDVSIKESSIDKRSGKQSGYGFVHFANDSNGVEAAFQAVAGIDNATIDGVTYNVELSKNLLKQFHDLYPTGGANGPGSDFISNRPTYFPNDGVNSPSMRPGLGSNEMMTQPRGDGSAVGYPQLTGIPQGGLQHERYPNTMDSNRVETSNQASGMPMKSYSYPTDNVVYYPGSGFDASSNRMQSGQYNYNEYQQMRSFTNYPMGPKVLHEPLPPFGLYYPPRTRYSSYDQLVGGMSAGSSEQDDSRSRFNTFQNPSYHHRLQPNRGRTRMDTKKEMVSADELITEKDLRQKMERMSLDQSKFQGSGSLNLSNPMSLSPYDSALRHSQPLSPSYQQNLVRQRLGSDEIRRSINSNEKTLFESNSPRMRLPQYYGTYLQEDQDSSSSSRENWPASAKSNLVHEEMNASYHGSGSTTVINEPESTKFLRSQGASPRYEATESTNVEPNIGSNILRNLHEPGQDESNNLFSNYDANYRSDIHRITSTGSLGDSNIWLADQNIAAGMTKGIGFQNKSLQNVQNIERERSRSSSSSHSLSQLPPSRYNSFGSMHDMSDTSERCSRYEFGGMGLDSSNAIPNTKLNSNEQEFIAKDAQNDSNVIGSQLSPAHYLMSSTSYNHPNSAITTHDTTKLRQVENRSDMPPLSRFSGSLSGKYSGYNSSFSSSNSVKLQETNFDTTVQYPNNKALLSPSSGTTTMTSTSAFNTQNDNKFLATFSRDSTLSSNYSRQMSQWSRQSSQMSQMSQRSISGEESSDASKIAALIQGISPHELESYNISTIARQALNETEDGNPSPRMPPPGNSNNPPSSHNPGN